MPVQVQPYEILPQTPGYDWEVIQAGFAKSYRVDLKGMLPYKKTPAPLTRLQLRRLLSEAHDRKWKVLDLSGYKLNSIPDEIGELSSIEILILGSSITPSYGDASENTYSNTFDTLPDSIGNLTSLKLLSVRNVPLTKLPTALGKLTGLRYLDVSGEKCFRTFPDVVYHLTGLRVLLISYSDSLKYKAKPHKVPERLWNFKQLQSLSISGNRFVALPEKEGQLPSLERLEIKWTSIGLLPDTITNFPALKELVLHENEIRSLPEDIGCIKTLVSLEIRGESIKSIPNSMANLANLERFVTEKTPLDNMISMSMKNVENKKMVKEKIKLLTGNDEGLYFPEKARMLIIGADIVGKTSLANRLIFNIFSKDPPSTVGIDIGEWVIERYDDGKPKKQINIWDFGGQEKYYGAHQFFLSNRAIYVLEWEANTDLHDIDLWLNTISLYAEQGTPVFAVVNKVDLINPINYPRTNIEALKQRFPQLKLYQYNISCQEGKGIDELAEGLKNYAYSLEGKETSFPEGWIKVKRHLSDLNKSKDSKEKYVISFIRYLDICADNGVNEEEAEKLIRTLHNLGIVLCYRDKSKLKDKVILELGWSVKAIYELLQYKDHENGIIQFDDLDWIWTNPDLYPSMMYDTILGILVDFQFLFKTTEDRKGAYLVPELLSDTPRPAPIGFSRSKETLTMRCQYEFLPYGLMSRFIVATATYEDKYNYILNSDNGRIWECWRKGAYLTNPENQARAKIEMYDASNEGYIDITIWSEDGDNGIEFLNILRGILWGINDSLPGLKGKEKEMLYLQCNCEPSCPYFFRFEHLVEDKKYGDASAKCYGRGKRSPVDIEHLLSAYGLQDYQR